MDELRLRVGAGRSSLPTERWLADALGLGGASTPTLLQLRTRLATREEHDLVTLLDAASPVMNADEPHRMRS